MENAEKGDWGELPVSSEVGSASFRLNRQKNLKINLSLQLNVSDLLEAARNLEDGPSAAVSQVGAELSMCKHIVALTKL